MLFFVISAWWIALKATGTFSSAIIIISSILILFCWKGNSIPYLGLFFQNQYFRAKFRITLLKNNLISSKDNSPREEAEQNGIAKILSSERKKNIFLGNISKYAAIFLNSCYLNLLHFLILLTKNSQESFEILREEVEKNHREIINLKLSKNHKKEWMELESLSKKVKSEDIRDTDLLQKLVWALYEFHKRDKRKATVFSITGLSIIIAATVINSLISSLIFSTAFKSNAASHTWTQSDWSQGVSADNTGNPAPSNWNKFSQSTNINYSVQGEISLATTTLGLTQTTDMDFNAGTYASTKLVGTGSAAKISLDQLGIGATKISAGSSTSGFNCALLSNSTVDCWGFNSTGQLGDGSTTQRTTPVSVSGISTALTIAAGTSHACALLSDHTVKCWGDNSYGQVGDGSTTQRKTPVAVSGISTATAITTGGYHTCALLSDHSIKCWGRNDSGQLGDSSTTERHTPVSVSIISTATAIDAGISHTCALLSDNTEMCWGANTSGQLGDGTTNQSTTPVPVSGISTAQGISAGSSHSCAVLSNNTIKCWGLNNKGQLGNGTATDSPTPVSVSNISTGTAVSAGTTFSCALLSNGTVKCWGFNYYGQLGDGTKIDKYSPVSVLNVSTATAVEIDTSHSCAVLSDGTVKCWGRNNCGQLGDGSTTDSTTPVSVSGIVPAQYYSSGTFTSAIIPDLLNVSWDTLTWNDAIPANTGITIKVRSCNDAACAGETAFGSITQTVAKGQNVSAFTSIHNGDPYFQYQATLDTSDSMVTPELSDITINRVAYLTSGTLTSSAFNAQDSASELVKIEWNEGTLPQGTDLKFQLRTAANNGGVPGAWSDWLGPTGSGDYYTASSGTEIINPAHADMSNDQWFQYKVFLTSDGQSTPQLSDVTLTYAYNNRPQVQNITASQGSDDDIAIGYEVRDSDTESGYITPSFQYSTDNGLTWHNMTTGLPATATSTKIVEKINFSPYSLTWHARNQVNAYSTTAKIKVLADDGELVNNIASSTSAGFTLDTKAPTSPAITIKSGDLYASSTAVTLTSISAADNVMTGLQMMIGNDAAFTNSSWENYAASKSWTLTSGDELKTVYVKFKDWKGNISNAANDTITLDTTPPDVPQSMTIRDISNYNSGEYWLFLAWGVVTNPGDWKQYNIWRSTNGTNYGSAPYKVIDDRLLNYTLETGLDTNTTYYYKITTQDTKNNISAFSAAVNDRPNGQGGTDATPPTISNVATSSISTTQATITWTTDELAKSTVGYSTTAGNFETERGVNSMVTSHAITITGLTPETTYYFQVGSEDPSGNKATSTLNNDGYTFTTSPGPKIITGSVTASTLENTMATIEWKTDAQSDSYISYSPNSDLSGATQIGSDNLDTSHSVTITGLSPGRKYYYYVKSTESTNLAIDNNGGEYYTFTTTQDTAAPVISAVAASLITDKTAMISWTTDEAATSEVQFGTSGAYASSTAINANLDLSHTIKLSGLIPSTKYYYEVISQDGNNNNATSTEQNFTTLEKLSTETEVEEREKAAKTEGISQGEATGRASAGGGGVLIIDKTDKVAPLSTNMQVSEIKHDTAKITWQTNEKSYSFLDYGKSTSYGMVAGNYDLAEGHAITLNYLDPGSTYHYRIASVDAAGNLSISSDQTFSTPAKTEEDKKEEEKGEQQDKKEENEKEKEKLFQDIEALADPNKGLSKEEILVNASQAAQKAMEIINDLSSQISLNDLEPTIIGQYNSFQKISSIIPPPLMSGTPSVITTATTAIIAWKTDKESNSLVALAPDSAFKIAREKDNPYLEVRGNSNEKTKEHIVTAYELKPDTIYHYQVRSQGEIGPMAKSSDFTFKTKTETLEISNYAVQNVSNEKAIFKWVTNLETDSEVKYIPYRDNKLMIEEAKTAFDRSMSIIHEIELDSLEAGITYNIQLSGKDLRGQIITKEIPAYSTSKDDLPPIIYQVQTESAISPGKGEKIQTIISWLTNEPATSRVYYSKGINQQEDIFTEKTQLDGAFIKKHVVIITKFEPGLVYSFKVESLDSGGNTSLSKTYTILTPRQKESVFQVIMKNLEQTFGWMAKIRN